MSEQGISAHGTRRPSTRPPLDQDTDHQLDHEMYVLPPTSPFALVLEQ